MDDVDDVDDDDDDTRRLDGRQEASNRKYEQLKDNDCK